MRYAIATVCLSGGLSEKLQAIANARFKLVELFENDLLSFNGTPRDVRRMMEDLGLQTITFQPFRDFEGMPPDRRARGFQRAERKFDVMQELGCDLLMICSNVSPESLGGIDRASDDLHELGERAARRGARVAFEALSWGRHIFAYRDSWEAVRCADHPSVGLVLDSFHNILYERDGDGEYFQLYTRTFANRFFFEIVERRRDYAGFGASNAQIRLASQARFNPTAADQ